MKWAKWIAACLAVFVAHGSSAAVLQKECEVRPFTDENIVEIIRRERSIRNDLVEPFEQQEIKQFRDGCYYIYQEWKLPKTPGLFNLFVLDQYGVIVDVRAGGH